MVLVVLVVPLVRVVPVVLQCGSIGSSCVSSESRSFPFIVVIVVPVFCEVPVVLVGLTRGLQTQQLTIGRG